MPSAHRFLPLAATLALVAGCSVPQTSPADGTLLSVDRIFASRDFAAERFGPARWMADGDSYTTVEPTAGGGAGLDLVLYRADSGAREVLVDAGRLVPPDASAPLAIDDYAWSPDRKVLIVMTNSRRVWRQNTRGDFWTYDMASGRLRQLGARFEASTLMFAKLSPDGRKAAYVVKNNIYVEDLAESTIRALTTDGTDDVINGTSDWVNEEEFGIRDGFRWSPDSRLIAYWQFDTHGVPVFTMINNTDELYPKTTSFKHPKAGQPNSAVRVGVVPAAGGPTIWMQTAGDPHDIYIPLIDWADNAEDVIFQQLNRLQNTNEVQLGSAATGQVRTIFVDKDEAWLDDMASYVWLAGGKGLFWLSERDGWRHAYYVSRDGSEVRLMTPGDYDVISVDAIDEKSGVLYVTASPDNATTRFQYRVLMDGTGTPERVGPATQTGVHRYDVSPTARWAFHTFSTLDTPPQVELVRLPSGETVRPLAANTALRATVEALSRKRVEYTTLDIGDDVQVDSWRILPPNFDPTKKYPLLVYVYGEPAGQTVQDSWGGNRYLWHLMLAQQGYIVASFDNHGTPAPRGRAWRKSVYRQIGILASADQAAAVSAAIAAWPYVDADRVGSWGWSGGGQMTLNALFRYPELYKTGVAVSFVSDQRVYDSIYQERFMGLPQDNAEGYKNGSPITFAKNLKGNLLIVHGTGDDNVHYQSFEMLVNELIANDKQFTMMSYPNRSHGISEGPGTTPHLYTLLTNYLNTHLPPGGR